MTTFAKLSKKQQVALVEKCRDIVAESINSEDYDKTKCPTVHSIFMAEAGNWKGDSIRAIQDWLQGLPSSLTLPFEFCETSSIIEQATGLTNLESDDCYWTACAIAASEYMIKELENAA